MGAKQEDGIAQKINKIQQDEVLKFNVLSSETPGRVIELKDEVHERLTLAHHESGSEQPRLHEPEREGGFQQETQQQVSPNRVGPHN